MRVMPQSTPRAGRRSSRWSPDQSQSRADPRDPLSDRVARLPGAVIASVAPTTTVLHVDGQRPGLVLEATLPFTSSTAAVVVSGGGVELARRTRSPHAPTVKLVTPSPRSHLSGRTATLVRWTARDADGDRLTATVDYSADGGRHWRVVADRVRASSARVPSRLLSASHNGRLRVRVSDGFNAAVATSGRLRAAGTAPIVRITRSGRGGRVREHDAALAGSGVRRRRSPAHRSPPQVVRRQAAAGPRGAADGDAAVAEGQVDPPRRDRRARPLLAGAASAQGDRCAAGVPRRSCPDAHQGNRHASSNRGRIDGPVGVHDCGCPPPRRAQAPRDHDQDPAGPSRAAPEVLASGDWGRHDPRDLRGRALNPQQPASWAYQPLPMGSVESMRELVVRFTEDPEWLPSVSRDITDAIHAELPT